MDNRIVINTGPLIAFGRMECINVIRRLPFKFLAPEQVRLEVMAGNKLGYATTFPDWINILPLLTIPSRLTLSNLDAGEAAVIETALQNNISTVCIDDLKGRRAAFATGLAVVGSLGILRSRKRSGTDPKRGAFGQEGSGIRYPLR